MKDLQIRLAVDSDVPALRRLVNAAYSELADMGLNFTGTFQDEEETRERMMDNDVYLLFLGDELIGTVSLEVVMDEGEKPVLYISQLAVAPAYKRRGLGRFLLGLAEDKAREKGIKLLRLDTAQPAEHLVTLYQSCGFVIVREIQWRGKVYKSYIMEKALTEKL